MHLPSRFWTASGVALASRVFGAGAYTPQLRRPRERTRASTGRRAVRARVALTFSRLLLRNGNLREVRLGWMQLAAMLAVPAGGIAAAEPVRQNESKVSWLLVQTRKGPGRTYVQSATVRADRASVEAWLGRASRVEWPTRDWHLDTGVEPLVKADLAIDPTVRYAWGSRTVELDLSAALRSRGGVIRPSQHAERWLRETGPKGIAIQRAMPADPLDGFECQHRSGVSLCTRMGMPHAPIVLQRERTDSWPGAVLALVALLGSAAFGVLGHRSTRRLLRLSQACNAPTEHGSPTYREPAYAPPDPRPPLERPAARLLRFRAVAAVVAYVVGVAAAVPPFIGVSPWPMPLVTALALALCGFACGMFLFRPRGGFWILPLPLPVLWAEAAGTRYGVPPGSFLGAAGAACATAALARNQLRRARWALGGPPRER